MKPDSAFLTFYLKLFKSIRDLTNDLVYDNSNIVDDNLKIFSFMAMVSESEEKGFHWLLLDDQREYVLNQLANDSEIQKIASHFEVNNDRFSYDFLEQWIDFKFGESGMINYFLKTNKDTEFIENFKNEEFLIKKGYEEDYENQIELKELRDKYRELLQNDFDPFVMLESYWGFENIPFYYIRLPRTNGIQFIGIFPIFNRNSFFKVGNFLFSAIKNAVWGANKMKDVMDKYINKLRKSQLKTAVISILVDSYAHNISAHSLAALKWWFQKREKIYDKRIELKRKDETTANDKPFINKLSQFSLKEIDTNILNDIAEKTNKYYKKLGLGDSNNNENFTSLMEIAQFSSYSGLLGHNYFYKAFDGNSQEIQNLNFHIPVPVDYALWPFMKFLRDKAGFWSGVTRDLPFGGESINLYDVLFKDFASNPLFLGTIAHSEGIHKLNIKLQIEGLLDDKILDFAQIDLSVIGYEENLLKSRDITINSDDKSEYSKYKFLRLGKDFEQIREEIKQEKYNMFFPGGIVGEHAFFTILENTLRNIKHYKNSVDWEDIIKDGIDFVISIKPAWLLGDSKENKRPELFNIEVWLDHKNIIYEKKNENGKEKIYDAYKTLVDNTKLPIVNDEGKPRLGGNAQDKICAAMLLNNTFKSVEDSVQSKIGKYYYNEKKESYWIGFNTKDITEEKKNNEIVKKIGKISKNFHLWKSEFIFVLKNLKDLQSENISRFKFVYIDSDDKGREELEIAAKDMGVIRILKKDDFEKYSINREFIEEDIRNILSNNLSRDTYYSIYLIWFKKFFQNLSFNIKKASDTPDPNPIHHIDNYSIDPINSKDDKNTIELIFAHGDKKGNTPWEVLDYRTHGKLRDTYFLDDNFNSYNNKKINEFIEILLTKICLFDDRIYERIPEEKIDYKIIEENSFNLYSEKLNLMFKPESRKEWDGINIQNDKKGILKENYNFLVVHLSFIENELGFSEKNINEFIEKELDIKKADTIEKFILVITTGRGRFEWHENLDPNYKKFTIFRPIESLLSSVEDAVAFKDDFQLKYNLVKVILGS